MITGMKINVPKGRYILAVSGGVDSMVLLDLLATRKDLQLIVGHFNHAIRPDSGLDEELVRSTAKQLGLRFEAGYGHLGPGASEAAAREARYMFLDSLKSKNDADAIITAHNQDDFLETALLNMLRGTGRRGLYSMAANKSVMRPMLKINKAAIREYANSNGVIWREDSTNNDIRYARNYLRASVIPKLTARQRRTLIASIEKTAEEGAHIDYGVAKLSQTIVKDKLINREKFSSVPTDIANELVLYWLKQFNVADPDRKTVERMNMSLRTAKSGARIAVKKQLDLKMATKTARFVSSV